MRIVGGSWRGRRLEAPPGRAVRPTSDRARESLFNILEHGKHTGGGGSPIPDARVLDAFAGSGALGIEALSRGAAHAVFLDILPDALATIERNLSALDADDHATVLRADCLTPPRATQACDLVFLDPPYKSDLAAPALAALAAAGWIAEGALCVVEMDRSETLTPPPGFALLSDRRYGRARLALLSYAAADAAPAG